MAERRANNIHKRAFTKMRKYTVYDLQNLLFITMLLVSVGASPPPYNRICLITFKGICKTRRDVGIPPYKSFSIFHFHNDIFNQVMKPFPMQLAAVKPKAAAFSGY